jgi:hypothetical protein
MQYYPGERVRRLLDRLTYTLMDHGLYVSRHSYSFRIIHGEHMIMSIHFYPVEGLAEIRVYSVFLPEAREALPTVLRTIRVLFPDYKVEVRIMSPPVIV